MQKTLVIIKPDAMHRRLVGRIIQRFEDKGLKIVALKMIRLSQALAEQHYGVHKGKAFYEPLLKFITSTPVVIMIIEAPGAIVMVRKMLGATFGAEAEPGSIRGDLAVSNRYNLVHGSDSPGAAEKEIELFFGEDEICDWTPADSAWVSEL